MFDGFGSNLVLFGYFGKFLTKRNQCFSRSIVSLIRLQLVEEQIVPL